MFENLYQIIFIDLMFFHFMTPIKKDDAKLYSYKNDKITNTIPDGDIFL